MNRTPTKKDRSLDEYHDEGEKMDDEGEKMGDECENELPTISRDIVPFDGPFKVRTREGTLTCPNGYLAMDSRGWPYPIAADEFEKICKEAEASRICFVEAVARQWQEEKLFVDKGEEMDRAPAMGLPIPIDPHHRIQFRKELEHLINCCCQENESDTPDHILAEYMRDCLDAFNKGVKSRDAWYGVKLEPGCGKGEES